MFLIITHIIQIYLHHIYKTPQIQLSTATPPPPPRSQSDANHRWCKQMQFRIIYMQILMIPMSKKKKNISDWLNNNFCS